MQVKPTKSEEETAKEKAAAEELKKQKTTSNKLLSMLRVSEAEEEEGWKLSVGNMFRCLCCPKPKPPQQDKKLELLLHRYTLLVFSLRLYTVKHTIYASVYI